MQRRVVAATGKLVDRALAKAGTALKDGVTDPLMPGFLKRGISGTVDEIMPEVKVEIMATIEQKVRTLAVEEVCIACGPARDRSADAGH